VVCSKTDYKLVDLEAQTDVEIFRDVVFGPELGVAIFLERDALDGFPSNEGVVADEGSAISTAYGVLDRGVYKVGEVGDAVFKGVINDLHDTRSMLEESDFGTLVHLERTVEETVFGNASVGIDDENDLADTDVATCPCPALIFLKHRCHSLLVQLILIVNSQVVLRTVTLCTSFGHESDELVLNTQRKVQTVVHVRCLLEMARTDEVLLISTLLSIIGLYLREETAFFLAGLVVLRSSYPTNVVELVEGLTRLLHLWRTASHT